MTRLTTSFPLSRSRQAKYLRGTFVLFAGAFVFPAACSSEPEIVGGGKGSCETVEDCDPGFTCDTSNKCVAACSSSEDCKSGEFCSSFSVCKAQCLTCGSACEKTADCPGGQYCSADKTCQQECKPGKDDAVCPSGACSENGQCTSDDDIELLGGAGGMGNDDDENEECIDLEVDFAPQIPNVVLLIDRSASMNAGVGFGDAVDDAIAAGDYTPWECEDNPDWRWNVLRNILFNPNGGVVKPLENDVRFGMSLYSSENGNEGDTCPILTEVSIGFGTHQEMLDNFDCDDYTDDTPTRESLTQVANALAAADLEGPKVIVLATDGVPDTCGCSDWDAGGGRPQTCCPNSTGSGSCEDAPNNDVTVGDVTYEIDEYEQYLVAQEAKRIHDELGITVEVINLNAPRSASAAAAELADHLDDVALNGGATSGAALDGFDPVAITNAFQTIIDGVRSCKIDLDGSIEEGKESTGTVRLDMDASSSVDFETLELNNETNGWQVNNPTQIELIGTACETIKTGDHALDISFPCGSFVPPPVQ